MTDKHTPGSIVLDRMLGLSTDSQVTAPCGCELFRSGSDGKSVTFRYCDTHVAAPKLLEALIDLDKVFDFSQRLDPGDFDIEDHAFSSAAFIQARAAIKAAKGDA